MKFDSFLFLLSLLILACSAKDKQQPPLQPDRFAQIYVEFVLSQESQASADSSLSKKEILAKHGVSPVELDSSISFYKDHPKLWLDVFEKISAELEDRKADLDSSFTPLPKK